MESQIKNLSNQINKQRIRHEELERRIKRLSQINAQNCQSPASFQTIPKRRSASWSAMSAVSSAYSTWNDDSVEKEIESKRIISEVNEIASRSAEVASLILKDFSLPETTDERSWDDILLQGLSLLEHIRDHDKESAKLVFDLRNFLYFAHKSRSFADVSPELKKVRHIIQGQPRNDLKLYISNLTQFIISSERFVLT